MELSRVIVGSIVTEKAERSKLQKTYVLQVRNEATKVDVINALTKFYDVDVTSVRVQRVGRKVRQLGAGKILTKRHPYKKVYVTLGKKSPSLDLSASKAS